MNEPENTPKSYLATITLEPEPCCSCLLGLESTQTLVKVINALSETMQKQFGIVGNDLAQIELSLNFVLKED